MLSQQIIALALTQAGIGLSLAWVLLALERRLRPEVFLRHWSYHWLAWSTYLLAGLVLHFGTKTFGPVELTAVRSLVLLLGLLQPVFMVRAALSLQGRRVTLPVKRVSLAATAVLSCGLALAQTLGGGERLQPLALGCRALATALALAWFTWLFTRDRQRVAASGGRLTAAFCAAYVAHLAAQGLSQGGWAMPEYRQFWGPVIGTVAPLGMTLGVVLGVIDRAEAAAEDATRSARLAQEKEEWLRLACSSARLGIWDVDLSTGTRTWNEDLRQLHGVPDDHVVTEEVWLATVHPDDRERVHRVREDAIQAAQPIDVDYRILLPDGTMRWVGSRGRTVPDESGRIVRIMGVDFDLTAVKEAKTALEESEERLRAILDGSPVMVYMKGLDGRLLFVNRLFEQLFQVRRQDVIGRTDYELFPRHVADQFKANDERVLASGPCEVEEVVPLADGSMRTYVSEKFPLLGRDGRPYALCGISLDITRRKQAEDAHMRSNQALQQFAYAAAHDLQEPLRNVSLCGELLARRYLHQFDPDGVFLLGNVVEGAQRMHSMVRDLLDYTKVVDHQAGPAPGTGAQAAMEKALANLQIAIQESGAVVHHLSLPTVVAHETHLVQLFQNLIGNAIKYARRGVQPQVQVTAEREGMQWVFRVADNGIGFDQTYAERIFGVFKRLHQRQEYPGTGIGLALCARIVEHYGGRIWAESRPGHGATFHFTLPAAAAKEQSAS